MKTNPLYPCSMCGHAMKAIEQERYKGGVMVLVTCCQGRCPMNGFTLGVEQHAVDCETKRREIVLTWGFDRCLSRPVPITLTTALTLLIEVASVTKFRKLRAGYCKFVQVCFMPDLLAAAEGLMQRCVTVNGNDTVNGGEDCHE